MAESELNLTVRDPVPLSSSGTGTGSGGPPAIALVPFNADEAREKTRGDLARGLLWLLTFAVGGVLAFIGLGRLEGSVLSQSIFPSLIALAGTALGFYFGSQTSLSGGRLPEPASQPEPGPRGQPGPAGQPGTAGQQGQPGAAGQPLQPGPAEPLAQPGAAGQPLQPGPAEPLAQPEPAEPVEPEEPAEPEQPQQPGHP